MFSKVLVANRGEIAVRSNQTLLAMGIVPVAVYSRRGRRRTARNNLWGVGFSLPGNSAEETYLSIPRIVEAARKCGAEAIHPGYGFLSENPAFARATRDAGLVFIGPSAESMESLGDKLRSKEIALRANVPVVPSSPECLPGDAAAAEFVERWDLPLLVKAAAGGGGRGMRLVHKAGRIGRGRWSRPAAKRRQRSAMAVYSWSVTSPTRDMCEFQVLADESGHTLQLGERECSIQRRHQKIIEETPSPALTQELRKRMGDAAVSVARGAGYVNAGTAEFLLDLHTGEFYFLEMNARLQVEHPITETVLGLDMVEWQVRIASGEPLTLGQADIQPQGHAIECRIYAEDPYHDFAPSTGTLLRWRPPSGPGLRLDSGVSEGQEVSIYYDPMLAKLTSWGQTRDLSLRRMEVALSQFQALGVVTNIPLLHSVMKHSQFRKGEYDTGFLEWNPAVTLPHITEQTRLMSKALAAWAASQPDGRGTSPVSGRRPEQSQPVAVGRTAEAALITSGHGELHEVHPIGGDPYRYRFDEVEGCLIFSLGDDGQGGPDVTISLSIDSPKVGEGICRTESGRSYPFAWAWADQELHLWLDGAVYVFQRADPTAGPGRGRSAVAAAATGDILAPMPGAVLEVLVAEGDEVGQNQTVVVMESMKMELLIAAPRDGVVKHVSVEPGHRVERGMRLLELAPEGEAQELVGEPSPFAESVSRREMG